MIQVRNVPERLHRELLRRARAQGRPLTTYIQELLEREVARPTREEVFARIARRAPAGGRSAAAIIRRERSRREAVVVKRLGLGRSFG
jgi:hypothetical protein